MAEICSCISAECEDDPLVLQHLADVHTAMVSGYLSLSPEMRAQTGRITAKFYRRRQQRQQTFMIVAQVFSRSVRGEYLNAEARLWVDDFSPGLVERVSFALRNEVKNKIAALCTQPALEAQAA